MSLDVYIMGKSEKQEWTCAHCGADHIGEVRENFFEANITHNLGRMAEAAGIYNYVWRPDEIGVKTASELIEPLQRGIAWMKHDPDKFKPFSASNGWGTYEQFVPWLERYLQACIDYPDGEIDVSR